MGRLEVTRREERCENNMTTAEEKYGKLLYKGPPDNPAFFRNHPRMSLQNRAKIFSPFAALRGHGDTILAENDKLLRVQRILLSEDDAAVLSDKLMQLEKGMEITVEYFVPDEAKPELGNYIALTGKVTAIDPAYRYLKIESNVTDGGAKQIDTTVKFDDLLDVSGKDIVDIDTFLGIDTG